MRQERAHEMAAAGAPASAAGARQHPASVTSACTCRGGAEGPCQEAAAAGLEGLPSFGASQCISAHRRLWVAFRTLRRLASPHTARVLQLDVTPSCSVSQEAMEWTVPTVRACKQECSWAARLTDTPDNSFNSRSNRAGAREQALPHSKAGVQHLRPSRDYAEGQSEGGRTRRWTCWGCAVSASSVVDFSKADMCACSSLQPARLHILPHAPRS